MLGKRSGSTLLRSTSSRSLVMACEGTDGEHAAFFSTPPTEKNYVPPMSDPCKIVIGFDLGSVDTKPPVFCGSPRSVLDAAALIPVQSPRSCLSNLLSQKSVNGEVASHGGKNGEAYHCMESHHGHQKGGLPDYVRHQLGDVKNKVSLLPTSNSDSLPWQQPTPNKTVKDDLLDADLHSCQRQGLQHYHARNGFLEERVTAPRQSQRLPYVYIEDFSNTGDCSDQHFLHLLSDERKEIAVQQSIFYAASPPFVSETGTMAFLNKCALCGCGLCLGKDVFMYRGDQAFCSAECRDRTIAIDVCKKRQGGKCGVLNQAKRTLLDSRVRGFV